MILKLFKVLLSSITQLSFLVPSKDPDLAPRVKYKTGEVVCNFPSYNIDIRKRERSQKRHYCFIKTLAQTSKRILATNIDLPLYIFNYTLKRPTFYTLNLLFHFHFHRFTLTLQRIQTKLSFLPSSPYKKLTSRIQCQIMFMAYLNINYLLISQTWYELRCFWLF